MRTRTRKEPELQATSAWYGTRTVLTHAPEQHKPRGYASRDLERKADQAIRELNKLFEIN